ncbi:MAG: hypothetical protein CM15mP51_03230 [Porticoccaceae bacterium]|nr:MAG: hypothetical protein CM15mP51_03230 [Porticoccaceae bacterium]
MRFDVNISVRPAGFSEFGTRTETKTSILLNLWKMLLI